MCRSLLSTFIASIVCVLMLSACGPKLEDGEYQLHLLTTGDVHGKYFDSTYVDNSTVPSLMTVSHYVNTFREKYGKENVILVDAGDNLQGDNASFYYNFVDTISPHIYPRIANYMGYDAVIVGNHDIEAGHSVFNRVAKELEMPLLAANAVKDSNNMPYFGKYTILEKHGFRVLVLGYTNANIDAWVPKKLSSGIHFVSITDMIQKQLNRILREEDPDVVVVVAHTGLGSGDGSRIDNQGLDIFDNVEGIDFLVLAHDHNEILHSRSDCVLINQGGRCKNIGHGVVNIEVKNGKVVSKSLRGELLCIDKKLVDEQMRKTFRPEYEAVKNFSQSHVGNLDARLLSRGSFAGPCPYINFIHTVQILSGIADVSLAAPLDFNLKIEPKELVYSDMFKLYPFENDLIIVELTGNEIKNYLEDSYDKWIQTVDENSEHLFRISRNPGKSYYSFDNPTFNFDSAAGLIYDVDVTKKKGERITIHSMSTGRKFKPYFRYRVAMTSYRASAKGMDGVIHLDDGVIESRIVKEYSDIRTLMQEFIETFGKIDYPLLNQEKFLGTWSFTPEEIAKPLIEKDMKILFPDYEPGEEDCIK